MHRPLKIFSKISLNLLWNLECRWSDFDPFQYLGRQQMYMYQSQLADKIGIVCLKHQTNFVWWQYFVLKKFITLETILLLSGSYIWQHLHLVMERRMALQQNDQQEKHIFVYFVDFVQFFTWGKFCLWHLWRFSSLGQNLFNYHKPSAFVLKAFVITENLS